MLLSKSPERAVLCMAAASRVLVATLFLVWRHLADPYDTSAELSQACLSGYSSGTAMEPQTVWGRRLGAALERTIVWDAVHYVRIAECGYEYEQVHAFLPGLPLLMRFLSQSIFRSLISVLGLRPVLALSGYVISNIAFILAALFLYRLTKLVLEDEKQAVQAVALFCLNPASTFYSAIYSESLFSLLSFAGLWHFLKGTKWAAIIAFGLSGAVRSNGILHAGFILFQAMHHVYDAACCQRRFKAVVPIIIVALVQSVLVFAPFVAFQHYGFTQLCLRQVKSEKRPWCMAAIPYLYGFVQSYYWDVGFLHYFQLKQLPNFVLASPMLGLSVFAILSYAKRQPKLFFLLGLAAPSSIRVQVAMKPLTSPDSLAISDEQKLKLSVISDEESKPSRSEDKLRRRKGSKAPGGPTGLRGLQTRETGFHSPQIVCFLVQLAFMVATAAFVMHVQVATRFLSVSAAIYWYGAYLLSHEDQRGLGCLVWTIFLSYIGVGSLLFINFYPFT